jgi:hypothetical protein
MKNLRIALTVILGSVILSGCTLQQMIKAAKDSDLKVNPNPLEVHGGKVPHELSATLPPKTLRPGKIYTIYTMYEYGDKSVNVGTIEVKADDYPNSSTQPTPVNQTFSFDYVDGMNPGKLTMYGEAKDPRNGKTKQGPKMDIATGLVMTSTHFVDIAYASYADHGYNDQEEFEATNVNFYFERGKSSVNESIKTDGKTNRDKNKELAAFIAEKNVTRTVTITGTHSPEGRETINTNLSADRAKAIEKIYRANMKKYDYKGMADSIKFINKPIVQDWAAFRAALAEYTGVSDESKAKMNQIINGEGSFVDKEKELQKVDGYKKVFDNVYPGLRTAQTEILTVKEKKTPAEIAVLAKQMANGEAGDDALSIEELLYAGANTPSLEEKEAIYKKAAAISGSWVAHNNLGATYIEMAAGGDKGKVDAALTQLEIAKNKNASAPEVNANLGAAYILQGDNGQAYAALGNAKGGNNELSGKVNSMKGTIEGKNGEYDKAKASFNAGRNDAASNLNRGLVNLLSKDYNAATSNFANVKKDNTYAAKAYYLDAVTSARQSNAAGITSNLKEAVSRNADYKQAALSDLEFVKYADAVAQAVR